MRIPRMAGLPRPAGARGLWWGAPLAGVCVLLVLQCWLAGPVPLRRQACWPLLWTYDDVFGVSDDFEGFDNETGVRGAYIVPNTVHFLRLGQPEFTLLEYVCVLAAWRRQRPDWIMFHTDLATFRGRFWQRILEQPGIRDAVQLVPTAPVTHVFGQPLDASYGRWHGGDVARIIILQKYGGIFLDNDAYLVQSLDPLRKFEMTLGWPAGAYLGTQILVAHPDARFLRLWLESYRAAYVGTLWYYNAGQRPTELVLHARPELVHREPLRLGVHMEVLEDLYLHPASDDWMANQLAVHLFERHTGLVMWQGWKRGLSYPVTFTEDNICAYNVTVLRLAKDMLPELCSQ